MNLKTKKLIARETIIIFCIAFVALITFCVIKIQNSRIDSKREILISESKALNVELDSILRLPWNLNWGGNKPQIGQAYNESNSPEPDFEYSKKNSKTDSSLIVDLGNRIEVYKLRVINLNNIDANSVITQIIFFVIIAVYPLRGLILLLIWSIKTLKK